MELKALITRLHEHSTSTIDMSDAIQKALIYDNLKLMEGIKGTVSCILKEEGSLTEKFIENLKSNPDAAFYVAVAGHLGKIADSIGRVGDAVAQKINEGILFSDKAMDEINFLIEKTKDILSNTSDMILARNRIVAGYIAESETNISNTANDFSTRHEERLIEGTCLPKASSLYIEILSAFKSIAWHAKEIAQGLRG
ncbi:MAG: hypothetical protein HY805_03665 [Nitrospirae bacterium]|nr:hypothetical protein [Nitrospirota bacterium]